MVVIAQTKVFELGFWMIKLEAELVDSYTKMEEDCSHFFIGGSGDSDVIGIKDNSGVRVSIEVFNLGGN